MSDPIKVFLVDPQWPEHIKDPQLKQFFENIIILGTFLISYSCSFLNMVLNFSS